MNSYTDNDNLYSTSAEQAVIATSLMHPETIKFATSKLQASDFFHYSHRFIFSKLSSAHAVYGQGLDLITFESTLTEEEKTNIGGFSYLVEMCKIAPSLPNVGSYIDIVKDLASRRALISSANNLMESVKSGDVEAIEKAKTDLSNVKVGANRSLFCVDSAINEMLFMMENEAPEIDGVFNECLPLGEPAILSAGGGTGKSFTTIQMCISVATGRPVFEGSVPFLTPKKKGKTVIIAAEDGRDDYHRRLRSIITDNRIDEQERMEIATSVLIKSLRGEDVRIITSDKQGTKITNFVERLAETLRPFGDIRMIILDPMIRFYDAEENGNSQATMFINAANKLSNLLPGNPAVLLVHHSSKADPGGCRGASGFVDGARTHLSMLTVEQKKKKIGDKDITPEDRNRVVLEMLKSNHFRYWDSYKILSRAQHGTLHNVDLRDIHEDDRASEKAEEMNKKYLIVQAVEMSGGISRNQLENDARKTILWGGVAPTRDKMKRMIDELLDDNALEILGEGVHRKIYVKQADDSAEF